MNIPEKNPNNKLQECDKKDCTSNVELQLHNDNYSFVSKYMYKTVSGYRNKGSCWTTNHFCSEECMEYFKKYNCCRRCKEEYYTDDAGTFIEVLGYTLCNRRCDRNPSCISNMNSDMLKSRFEQEYSKCGYYKIDAIVIDKLLQKQDCDDLKQIIANNGNMVSYNMLKDMYIFYTDSVVRHTEEDELVDEETFNEYYNMIKDKLL